MKIESSSISKRNMQNRAEIYDTYITSIPFEVAINSQKQRGMYETRTTPAVQIFSFRTEDTEHEEFKQI